jgi:type IV secretory pathway VirB10-like protein
MISRSLAVGLFAAGCLTAAAGGSYLAVRQNAASAPAAAPATQPEPAVNETEAVISPEENPRDRAPGPPVPAIDPAPPEQATPPPANRRVTPRSQPVRRPAAARAAREPSPPAVAPTEALDTPVEVPATTGLADMLPAREPLSVPRSIPAEAPLRPERVFEEVILPASSVVGLELETTVTSERAQVEDRVDARVTRDVYAEGRLAIPAGSRVIGTVTMVERGGKVKERARLGVRFHTLVLANGPQVSLRTETIHREGESPSNESSRKIGGATVGGAVLGAIIGGGKGAIAGATAGAAGGTAAVMAGGRNPATLAAGSIVTVKLTAPASFEIER